MSYSKNLIGERFGKLIVIKTAEKPVGLISSDCFWLCKCDCGNEKTVR
jgi:hypothetical protein